MNHESLVMTQCTIPQRGEGNQAGYRNAESLRQNKYTFTAI